MPGITMIGDSRDGKRQRPTSLPAHARSTCRLLRLLHDPKVSALALQQSLQDAPAPHSIQIQMKQTLEKMAQEGWDHFGKGQAENRMSLALHFALKTLKKKNNDNASTTTTRTTSSSAETKNDNKCLYTTTTQALTTPADAAAALVSDASATMSEEEEENQETCLSSSQVTKNVWARVIESLHLQVASRTTRVWGKKKMYEIYQLCSPCKVVTQDNLDQVRVQVEKEFRAIFHGGGEDQSGCRTYAILTSDGLVYIQINIGKPYDLHDESNRAKSGEKKKKKPNEYVALLDPGSSLLALTASRAPSAPTSRFTKYVLTALEAVLASTAVARSTGKLDESLVPRRFGEWTGTEPLELLQEATKTQTGQAVGRFANMAREQEGTTSTQAANPLVELHKVSTEPLVDRTNERKRLGTSSKHGRRVAQKQARIANGSALVAATNTSVLVDASFGKVQSRKRARDEQLGSKGDCPSVQRVAWKWTGQTTAAHACLLDDITGHVEEAAPTMEFKCGIVMEGPNVFEGLRNLMAAGFTKPTLPDYVRDAPTLGSATITVDHGEFGGTESFAAV